MAFPPGTGIANAEGGLELAPEVLAPVTAAIADPGGMASLAPKAEGGAALPPPAEPTPLSERSAAARFVRTEMEGGGGTTDAERLGRKALLLEEEPEEGIVVEADEAGRAPPPKVAVAELRRVGRGAGGREAGSKPVRRRLAYIGKKFSDVVKKRSDEEAAHLRLPWSNLRLSGAAHGDALTPFVAWDTDER